MLLLFFRERKVSKRKHNNKQFFKGGFFRPYFVILVGVSVAKRRPVLNVLILVGEGLAPPVKYEQILQKKMGVLSIHQILPIQISNGSAGGASPSPTEIQSHIVRANLIVLHGPWGRQSLRFVIHTSPPFPPLRDFTFPSRFFSFSRFLLTKIEEYGIINLCNCVCFRILFTNLSNTKKNYPNDQIKKGQI